MRRTRYQQGCLTREARKERPCGLDFQMARWTDEQEGNNRNREAVQKQGVGHERL